MTVLSQILANNQRWAARMLSEDPGFFSRLAQKQSPEYFWIGCSDSRVPANQICGLDPGEVFVHRNVANVVSHSDLNCLSVLQFAVEVLKVKHIIVCGHYGCGGVVAAMERRSMGLVDNWLVHIKDVYKDNQELLDSIGDISARQRRLCELNVAAQVANVCYTTIVQQAWRAGRKLFVHGLIYAIEDGLLHSLDLCVNSLDQLPHTFRIN